MSTLQQSQKPPAGRPVMPRLSIDALRDALSSATNELMNRGLNTSAKWTAELLCSLKPGTTQNGHAGASAAAQNGFSASTMQASESQFAALHAGSSTASGSADMVDEADERRRAAEEDESAQYLLALSYYRVHEHARAAHALRSCWGPRARWLRCYCKYLVRKALVDGVVVKLPLTRTSPDRRAEGSRGRRRVAWTERQGSQECFGQRDPRRHGQLAA